MNSSLRLLSVVALLAAGSVAAADDPELNQL